MSDLAAWGDESVHTQGNIAPTYYMGACVCDLEEPDIRRQLLTVTKKKVKKLHWRDMTPTEKRRSIPIISALSLPHIVVAAAPLSEVSPERARRKCLELMLPVLEQEYGVTHLILESREPSQDERDFALVRGLRSRHFINQLRVDFASGTSDARLWIADQVLGAVGDTARGSGNFSELVTMVDKREVDLCDLP